MLVLLRLLWRRDEDFPPAGRITRTFRIVRSSNGNLIDRRPNTWMAVHVEMHVVRLMLRFKQRRRVLHEGGSDPMRSGFHQSARPQVLIHFVEIFVLRRLD